MHAHPDGMPPDYKALLMLWRAIENAWLSRAHTHIPPPIPPAGALDPQAFAASVVAWTVSRLDKDAIGVVPLESFVNFLGAAEFGLGLSLAEMEKIHGVRACAWAEWDSYLAGKLNPERPLRPTQPAQPRC